MPHRADLLTLLLLPTGAAASDAIRSVIKPAGSEGSESDTSDAAQIRRLRRELEREKHRNSLLTGQLERQTQGQLVRLPAAQSPDLAQRSRSAHTHAVKNRTRSAHTHVVKNRSPGSNASLAHAIAGLPPALPPDPSHEAYATMWYGPPNGRAFEGLRAMVHSIRAVDELRPIVLLTLADNLQVAAAEAAATRNGVPNQLRVLAHAFPRVFLLPTPFFTIQRDRTLVCQTSLKRSCGGGGKGNRYIFMYSKFALWGLTNFSRVFYIDADALVMSPLDYLWSNVTLSGTIVAAASYTIRVGRRAEPICGRGWTQYNAGVMLVRPAAAIMTAVLKLLVAASKGKVNPCRGDQTFFNPWFAARHTRCMPHSLNCRDPRLQQNATAESATLSRCMDDERGRRVLGMPHVMHFACGTLPRASSLNDGNASTIYQRTWATHLARSDAHISEQVARAGGAANLIAANAGVVLEPYNPWKPICKTMTEEAQKMMQCT